MTKNKVDREKVCERKLKREGKGLEGLEWQWKQRKKKVKQINEKVAERERRIKKQDNVKVVEREGEGEDTKTKKTVKQILRKRKYKLLTQKSQ